MSRVRGTSSSVLPLTYPGPALDGVWPGLPSVKLMGDGEGGGSTLSLE